MAKEKKLNIRIEDEAESDTGFRSEETAEESGGWMPRMSPGMAWQAACEAREQAEDLFMALVPPEVTEHLINSQKELVRAGARVGEMIEERLDRRLARARKIHEEMKAAKARGSEETEPKE